MIDGIVYHAGFLKIHFEIVFLFAAESFQYIQFLTQAFLNYCDIKFYLVYLVGTVIGQFFPGKFTPDSRPPRTILTRGRSERGSNPVRCHY